MTNGVIQADFARLRNSLNTSGIQKSNNALFQIISRLIDVSEQAQDTIINEAIPEQIAAIPVGFSVQIISFNLSASQLKALFTTPIEITSPSGHGNIIVPISLTFHLYQAAVYGNNPSCSLYYSVNAGGGGGSITVQPLVGGTGFTPGSGGGTGLPYERYFISVANSVVMGSSAPEKEPINRSLYIRTTADLTGDASNLNSADGLLCYMIVPVQFTLVPEVTNTTQAAATTTLQQSDFIVGVNTEHHASIVAGKATRTVPIAGTKAFPNQTIVLWISLGP